ncbi:MAG: polysaccharide biosynthesis tyrosine autokinase [Acutalibacteraceae bacterium]|nr:polysaccharide biosynthesis tyrosine autokinase [Acutalibacteraceae bacterium]
MNNTPSTENGRQNANIWDLVLRTLNGIKKIWRILPVLAALFSLAFVVYAYKTYTPVYRATATFTVSSGSSSYYSTGGVSVEQLEKTFPYIITSPPLRKVVTEDLGTDSMPGTISSSLLEDTNLFTITVDSSSYEMAYNLLKSVINNYPDVAEYIIGDTEIVLVVAPTASSEPINKVSYGMYALIGAAVGIVLFIASIAIKEMLNVTVRRPDDIENLLNSKKVGSVVKVINKKSSQVTRQVSLNNVHIDARFKESIYSIRNTIIKKCEEKHINSIMITSTGAGEGKTTLSSNIAISFARKHYRTIIIDCDLRHPSVRKQLNIPLTDESLGIVDVITGKCNLEKAMLKMKKSGLYVLPGTVSIENASELMGSKQLIKLIKALEEMFDYVIVDAPPVGVVVDALELKDCVGSVLFAVRQDYIKVERIKDAISGFGASRIHILGCVFNMASGILGTKGYGRYGYSNYGYGGYSSYNKGYYRGKYGYGYGGYGGYGSYGYGYGDYGDKDESEVKEKDTDEETVEEYQTYEDEIKNEDANEETVEEYQEYEDEDEE